MFVAGLDADDEEFAQLRRDLRGALAPLNKSVIWPAGKDFCIRLVDKVLAIKVVLMAERENTTKDNWSQPIEPTQSKLPAVS
jgi:hypothetical protein